MATSGGELMSDEIVNIKCCVCANENRTREAEKYCRECKDYFCSSCSDMHRKFPALMGHKLLDKADFRSLGPDGSLPCYPTQRCTQHPLEVVNLYCKDHDEVTCALCIALTQTHRCCMNIVCISDEIENVYQGDSLDDVKQKITKTKTTLENIKATKGTKLLELKEALNKEIESVKEFRHDFNELLDKMEQETILELKEEFSRIQDLVAQDLHKVEDLVTSLDETVSQLNKSEGNKSQEFVVTKSSLKLCQMANNEEKKQQMATFETVSFIPDQSILRLLQHTDLGEVFINKTSKNSLYKVKNQREINVKLGNEKSCDIWGSCLTSTGYLLLSDKSNRKIKRVDMSTETVKDYIDIQSLYTAICMVNRTTAAVTMDNKTVQFVSIRDQMKAEQNLTMDHECYGMAHKSGKLFISDHKNTIYIYDINGHEQLRISGQEASKDIFDCNQNIAISHNGDRVFVAEYCKGVVVLDSYGNYLSTLHDSTVTGYRGVCTDGSNMFVSCYQSGNIVQFGQDFKILGKLTSVKKPLSMCFDHQHQRIIVSLKDNDKITILELK